MFQWLPPWQVGNKGNMSTGLKLRMLSWDVPVTCERCQRTVSMALIYPVMQITMLTLGTNIETDYLNGERKLLLICSDCLEEIPEEEGWNWE